MNLYISDIKKYAFESMFKRSITSKLLFNDGIMRITEVSKNVWNKEYWVLDGRGYHACVYFLVDNEMIVYIGQTTSEYRIRQHEKDKQFTSVWFIPVKAPYQIVLEQKLLSKYKTKYNKRYSNLLKQPSELYLNKMRVDKDELQNIYLNL